MLLPLGLLFSEYKGVTLLLLWVTWVCFLYITAGGLLHASFQEVFGVLEGEDVGNLGRHSSV